MAMLGYDICSFPDVQYSCPEGWEFFQGRCYNIPASGLEGKGPVLTGDSAVYKCKHLGGFLAVIRNEAIEDFVGDLLSRTAPDYVESVWVHWSHWTRTELGNSLYYRCAILDKDEDWRWDKVNCWDERHDRAYVCEIAAGLKVCQGDSCYELLGTAPVTVNDEPTEQCKKRGGYPVEINSQEEQTFVENFLNKALGKYGISGVWLGANDMDSEGNFVWPHGGTSVDDGFSNWAKREPNDADQKEDCTQLSKAKGWKWNDVRCSSWEKNEVLCESPNVSGITG